MKRFSGLTGTAEFSSVASSHHLLEVDIDGIIQDALAVSFIHHDESVHLPKAMKKNKKAVKQLKMCLQGALFPR